MKKLANGYTQYKKSKVDLHIFHLFSGKGSPCFDFPKSIREGMFSSQYVSALRLAGCLWVAAYLSTLKTDLIGFWLTGSITNHFWQRKSRQRASDETATAWSMETRLSSSASTVQTVYHNVATGYASEHSQWIKALIFSDDAPSIWSVPNGIALTFNPDNPMVHT